MLRKEKKIKKGTKVQRFFKSLARIVIALVVIIGGIYAWNPQKLHYPRKKAPLYNPPVDPGSLLMFSKYSRITAVTAHPDDSEVGISGTLLKLHKAGAEITLIVVTDGDKSYYTRLFTNAEENRVVRHAEQEEASKAYGAKVVFLGGADGRYDPDEPDLRSKLRQALIDSKPTHILAFDPVYLPTIQHRDHENTGKAVADLASETTAKYLLHYSTMAPNFWVDTTGFWDERVRLLGVHKSQFYGEKLERIKGMVYRWTSDAAEHTKGETAEAFRVVPLR
jgi:LmbE family N-acetylglucosaminyl deacetylase